MPTGIATSNQYLERYLTVQQSPIQALTKLQFRLEPNTGQCQICALNRGWNVLNGPWLTECYNATTSSTVHIRTWQRHILWNVNLGPCMAATLEAHMARRLPYWQCCPAPWDHLPLRQLRSIQNRTSKSWMDTCTAMVHQAIQWQIRGNPMQISFTGQLLWLFQCWKRRATMQLRNVNIKSAIPMLWYIMGTSWFCYDANTGKEMLQVTGCTSPTVINQIYQDQLTLNLQQPLGLTARKLLVFTAAQTHPVPAHGMRMVCKYILRRNQCKR